MTSKTLTDEQLLVLAAEFELEPAVLRTLLALDSPGTGAGFTGDGRVHLRFECHVFRDYSRIYIPEEHPSTQATEWTAFQKASRIYPVYAKLAAHWGLGLVPGYQFRELGYESVDGLVADCMESEMKQVRLWLSQLFLTKRLKTSLQNINWRKFSYYYHGEAGNRSGREAVYFTTYQQQRALDFPTLD